MTPKKKQPASDDVEQAIADIELHPVTDEDPADFLDQPSDSGGLTNVSLPT